MKKLFLQLNLVNRQKLWTNLIRPQLIVDQPRWTTLMNTLIANLALIALLVMCGCATLEWNDPYPPVPFNKSPRDKPFFTIGDFRYDTVERDPDHKEVFAKIDEETNQALKNHPDNGEFGFYHTWANTKRSILYWKHGIDWHDVQAMTPGLMID